MDFSVWLIVLMIIVPAAVLFGLFSLVRRLLRAAGQQSERGWNLPLLVSKEDGLSQFFLTISICFLAVSILSIRQYLFIDLSWQMVFLGACVLGVVCSYYFRLPYTLALSLIGFVIWWEIEIPSWLNATGYSVQQIPMLVGPLFMALLWYVVGSCHPKGSRCGWFTLIYKPFSLVAVSGILFYLSTHAGLEAVEDMLRGKSFLIAGKVVIALSFLVISLTAAFLYALNKKLLSRMEISSVLILAMLACVITVFPAQNLLSHSDQNLSRMGVVWAITLNVLIFLQLVGVLLLGCARREDWMVNLGVLFLFLLIPIKYFDWFFTFFDKSLFFITAGILLFIVGWFLERGRRCMIAAIKKENPKGA